MSILELNKRQLEEIGGPGAAEIYTNNDISFDSLKTAILNGITLEQIQQAIDVDSNGFTNDQKVEVLILLNNMRITGGLANV